MHPSTLDIIDQLGLVDELLKVPHVDGRLLGVPTHSALHGPVFIKVVVHQRTDDMVRCPRADGRGLFVSFLQLVNAPYTRQYYDREDADRHDQERGDGGFLVGASYGLAVQMRGQRLEIQRAQ